ncbi:MAG: hypothetical protein WC489_03820 [Patescibacteria group bacterium]
MKKKHLNNIKGVTLVELVLYMGILSVLLVLFVDLFGTMVQRQLETESLSSVQQDGAYILSRLSHDFQNASHIDFPTTPGATADTFRLNIQSVPYDFSVSNGNLVITHESTSEQINSYDTSIVNIMVERLGDGNEGDVLHIEFTLQSKVKKQGAYEVSQFSTTQAIREK